MFHFATPDDASSAAEEELALILENCATPRHDGSTHFALPFGETRPRLIFIVVAAVIGFNADERWTR